MNQFKHNRCSAIPPNAKLYAALLISDILSPPIGGRNSIHFATGSFVSQDDNGEDMHADSELRATAMAKAAYLGKRRRAPIRPFVCVTALVGFVLTFAGAAWIFQAYNF